MQTLMKFLWLCLSILLVYFAGSGAQAQEKKWEWVNPVLNGNNINGIDVLRESRTIAISYANGLLLSDDDGYLWRSIPMDHPMSAVFEFSSTVSFGLTRDGKIVKGVLQGAQDVVFSLPGTAAQFHEMYMDMSTGVGLAVGGYELWQPSGQIDNWGVIVRSSDFGETWTVVYEQEGDELKGLVHHDGIFTAYGTERYNFAVQSDDGTSWVRNENFGLGLLNIQRIEYVNDLVGFMTYDSHGNLYYTTDGGQSWQLRKDFDHATYGMTASDSTIVVITYGSLFVSTDLGVTWTETDIIHLGLTANLVNNLGDLVVVADQANGIFVRRDKGLDFVNVNENLERRILFPEIAYAQNDNRTVFTSPLVGYMPLNRSNTSSTLWKTEDGGCHWYSLTNHPAYWATTFLIHFLDDQTGFLIAGGFHKTTDGGSTWTTLQGPSGYTWRTMAFFTPTTGIALSPQTFLRTTDGGTTWSEVPHPFIDSWSTINISILNETSAFACFSEDRFMKTMDGGATWTATSTGFGMDWKAVHFFDTNNGIMAGVGSFYVTDHWVTEHVLVKTTDGGNTWSKVTDLPGEPRGMKFSSPTDGYLFGLDGMLMKTGDGGATWQEEKTVMAQTITDLFLFENDMILVGSKLAIARTANSVPVAAFDLPASICQGDTIIATNTSQDSQSYIWKLNGMPVSTEKDLKVPAKQAGELVVELASGTCNMTYYDVVSAPITSFEKPSEPLLKMNGRMLSAENEICDSTYTISTGPYDTYQWSNGSSSSEIVLGNEETLSVKVLSKEGCASWSDTVKFIRLSPPVAAFSVDYDSDTHELLFLSESDGQASAWWDLGDGTTATGSEVRHQYADNSQPYDVTLIATGRCGADTLMQTIDYDLILALGDEHSSPDIYPNPVMAMGLITLNDPTIDSYTMTGLSGRGIVKDSPVSNSTVTLPSLSPGVYLLYLFRQKQLIAVSKVLIYE